MVKIIIIYFQLVIIIACNCTEQNHSVSSIIDIESNIQNFKHINLSEFIDDIAYIPLETNNNSLLRSIFQVILTDELVFINDGFLCKSFLKNGEFHCNYGSQGKGPGQFSGVSRISVNEEVKKLYLSAYPGQLMEFSFDGQYIRDIDIPPGLSLGSSNFVAINDGFFCGIDPDPNSKFRLVLFNDDCEVINRYPNYFDDPMLKGNLFTYVSMNNIHFSLGFENSILYKDGLCDTAFNLNKENLQRTPAFIFKFGKYRNALEYLKSISGMIPDKGENIETNHFIETNSFILFITAFCNYIPKSEYVPIDSILIPSGVIRTGTPTNQVRSIYLKKSSEVIFLKRPYGYFKEKIKFAGFINDLDGGMPFWPIAPVINFDGSQLVMSIEAFELKDYIASDEFKNSKPKYPDKKKALEQLADSLNYEDNPVLMVVTLKNEK